MQHFITTHKDPATKLAINGKKALGIYKYLYA